MLQYNYLIKKQTGIYKNKKSVYSSNTPRLYDSVIEPGSNIHQQFFTLESERKNYTINCSIGKNIFTKLNNNV